MTGDDSSPDDAQPCFEAELEAAEARRAAAQDEVRRLRREGLEAGHRLPGLRKPGPPRSVWMDRVDAVLLVLAYLCVVAGIAAWAVTGTPLFVLLGVCAGAGCYVTTWMNR